MKKYSIGDMRERISLHSRVITPPNFDSVSPTQTYSAPLPVWSSVETLDKKKQLFGGVNIPEGATHSFIIRFIDPELNGFPYEFPIKFYDYQPGANAEYMIRWRYDTYSILKTADPDGRKMYIEFYARLLGDQVIEVNQ